MRIEVSGLGKVYKGGIHALHGVDLDVSRGMYGLLGRNGAGKTTLMRILAGLLIPSSGTVRIGGHDVTSARGRREIQRRLGYLPQDLGLYPDLTARGFLDYLGVLKGLDLRSQRRRRVGELLELVGLTEDADRRIGGFSGGMRRRVGIAQALLADPRLLIVDEPTAGLDPEERIRFRTLLAGLSADRTVLLSTNIIDDVAQTCGRVGVLDGGRLIFDGGAGELAARAGAGTPEPTLEDGYLALTGADVSGPRGRGSPGGT